MAIDLRLSAVDNANGEIDDGEGERADGEANTGVEDGVFGLLSFAGITGRGYILDATDDDEDDGNEARDTDNGIEDID